jgi:hypothetical protein
MAKRFLLVPSDQYQHMLNASSSRGPSSADEPLLAHTAKRVKALISNKGKKLNISVRKALFDQEFARYLRQRKEREERPVKVQITNRGGAKVMVDPKSRNKAVMDSDAGEASIIDGQDTPMMPLAHTPEREPMGRFKACKDALIMPSL